MWGDSTNSVVPCSVDNRTIFRSSGGFFIYTNGSLTTGAYPPAGSGSWANLSDRNVKANFAPVNPQAVLEGVANLPLSTWMYKSEAGGVRHLGPMAQDFYAAFGLGADNKHITTVDANGVALAAIQGLYRQNQTLKAENAELRQRMDALEARLSALERGSRGFSWPNAGLLALAGVALWVNWRGKGERR